MLETIGYGAVSQGVRLAPFKFQRRDPRPNDVVTEIAYCGVCHIELIRIQQINEAYERLQRNDVKYRFVIDAVSLQA